MHQYCCKCTLKSFSINFSRNCSRFQVDEITEKLCQQSVVLAPVYWTFKIITAKDISNRISNFLQIFIVDFVRIIETLGAKEISKNDFSSVSIILSLVIFPHISSKPTYRHCVTDLARSFANKFPKSILK